MVLHRAFGAFIESSIPLFDSVVSERADPHYSFHLFPADPPGLQGIEWVYQTALPDGSEWLSMAKRGSDFVLRFADMADFVISSDRRRIKCYQHPDTPIETIRHLFLDQVFPYLLISHDQLALHAGAVVVNGEAVAFLGESGQGKSTLCASFGHRGSQLIGDDCLLLKKANEKIFCLPSYPGVRLWDQSVSALFSEPIVSPVSHYSRKHRLDTRDNNIPVATEPIPLKKIYLLAPLDQSGAKGQIVVTPVAPNEAFRHLLNGGFRLNIYDHNEIRDEFNLISHILSKVRISRLSFPHEFAALPNVRQAIYADLD
jgi:hypothetical protein